MEHRISEVGAQMLKYQEQLARDYGYKPIPRTFFCDVRAEFQKALPEWCNVSGDTISLETADGTVITNGYNRIVIGDYGAFVEFSRVQACMRRLKNQRRANVSRKKTLAMLSMSNISGLRQMMVRM